MTRGRRRQNSLYCIPYRKKHPFQRFLPHYCTEIHIIIPYIHKKVRSSCENLTFSVSLFQRVFANGWANEGRIRPLNMMLYIVFGEMRVELSGVGGEPLRLLKAAYHPAFQNI